MEFDERFVGKSIPTSEFTDDDGKADSAVVQALVDFKAGSVTRSRILSVLAEARLFVPVKAVLDSMEVEDGHQVEKDSHMATVSIQSSDGRRGLLAFTSVEVMSEWDQLARPVAARGKLVAAAALDEEADAVLVDFGSRHTFVIEGSALQALATSAPFVDAVADPDVHEAVMAAVAEAARRHSCQFELSSPTGKDADARLTLLASADTDVSTALAEVAQSLAGSEVLRRKLALGLELGVRESREVG